MAHIGQDAFAVAPRLPATQPGNDMATLRESLQAEITLIEQSLATKRAALAAVPGLLDTPIAELRAMWRAIAAHIFGAAAVAAVPPPVVAAPVITAAPVAQPARTADGM